MSLPNLIIAGVVKAGTTSLFSYLSEHPDIGASKVKETGYFTPLRYGERLMPLNQYKMYFKHIENKKYVLESTPGYFYGGLTVAKKIDETLPNVRIILILREPVDRLVSYYGFKKAMLDLDKDMTFEDYLEKCSCLDKSEIEKRQNSTWYGIQGGKYEKNISAWLSTFEGRIKVVFFDELKSDKQKLLQDISVWLGIDNSIYDYMKLDVENKTLGYKNKNFQKLALLINRKGEPFFRKYPTIKKLLRNGYRVVNSQSRVESISDTQRDLAKKYYINTYSNLASIFKNNGINDLPGWLKKY